MADAPITALVVADWFLKHSGLCEGEPITHLKLQKLIYYAQAWALVFLKKPLFDEDFEAWVHGPVAVSVYEKYAGCGWDELKPDSNPSPVFSEETASLLTEVAETYGAYGAKKLEDMTHAEEPWAKARGNLPPHVRSNAKLDKALMAQYYGALFESVDTPA